MDPAHQERGVRGLQGHSRGDEQVWNEFRNNWDQMTVLSEAQLQDLHRMGRPPNAVLEQTFVAPDVETESETTVRVRLMQGFFRKAVLAAYNSRCCVTGNPMEELLVASHILPWSTFPEQRLNPRNGLCLAAHYDRAFDRGLITFDHRMTLVLSPALKDRLPNDAIEIEFAQREGRPLVCPDRFLPEAAFLTYHREQIYRAD